jgi:hypothetical protein
MQNVVTEQAFREHFAVPGSSLTARNEERVRDKVLGERTTQCL